MKDDKSHISQQTLSSDLAHFLSRMKVSLGGIFAPDRDIYVCRVPMNLAVMGELVAPVCDLVIHYPLQQAMIVAMQKRVDRRIIIRSFIHEPEQVFTDELLLDGLFHRNHLRNPQTLRKEFSTKTDRAWMGSILGSLSSLITENILPTLNHGFNLAIESTSPLGNGAISISAIQCALFLLLKKIYSIPVDDLRLLDLPGLFAQDFWEKISSKAALLSAALCQKDELLIYSRQQNQINYKDLTSQGIQFVGLHCDVSSIKNEKYCDFGISLLMCSDLIDATQKSKSESPNRESLVNISPEEWLLHWSNKVPHSIQGKEYLDMIHHRVPYKSLIQKDKKYPIRRVGEYAIKEHHRNKLFLELLDAYLNSQDKEKLIAAGAVLNESQKDWEDICGKYCQLFDVVFEMVRKLGPEKGFYGARCSYGGDEGIATLLTFGKVDDYLKNIAAQFKAKTDLNLRWLTGSSDGALKSGIVTTRFE